jgi:hypothetical protein
MSMNLSKTLQMCLVYKPLMIVNSRRKEQRKRKQENTSDEISSTILTTHLPEDYPDP